MIEVTQEAIEEAAPLLDDALREPCSIEMAERILKALAPIIDRHRQAGVQQGLDMAAGICDLLALGMSEPIDPKDITSTKQGLLEAARATFSESAKAIQQYAAAIRKLGGDDGTNP